MHDLEWYLQWHDWQISPGENDGTIPANEEMTVLQVDLLLHLNVTKIQFT